MAEQRALGRVLAVDLGDDLAFAHDEDARADVRELFELGRDDEHAEARGGELADDPVDLRLRGDVDPARRLVQKQDATLAEQPAGEHDLLLVAAGEQADHAVRVVGHGVQRSELLPRGLPLLPNVEQDAREATEVGDRDVLRLAPVEDERLRLAILRREPEAAADRRPRVSGSQRLPLEDDLALVQRVEAVDQPEELRPAGADEPAEPDDLAGPDLQAHAAHGGKPSRVANLQQHLVGSDWAVRVQLLDLAPDHELDEPVGRRRRRNPGRCRAAVREHRHAVADAADLVEPVRDVDDADALRGEPANDLEQRADLAFVEDRRRLVHDQQPHVAGERSCDRDDLLRGGTQLPHLGAHRNGRRVRAG